METLHFIGVVGFASTSQVALGVGYPSEDRARRRLRELLDAKLLRVCMAAANEPNLVALTPVGLTEVRAHYGDDTGARLHGAIKLPCAHHLLGVDARTFVVALAEAKRLTLHGWYSGRTEFASRIGLAAHHLVADAVADVTVDARDRLIAVEVDCGTEGASVISRKLAKYNSWLRATPNAELWMIAEGGPLALERMYRLADGAAVLRATRVFAAEQLRVRPVATMSVLGARCTWRGHAQDNAPRHSREDTSIQYVADRRPDAVGLGVGRGSRR